MFIVDSQVHIWAPESPERPWIPGGAARIKLNGHREKAMGYEELRSLFESSLPRDPQLYNEYHALIVRTGKDFCRKSKPLCSACALKPFLPPGCTQ